MGKTENVQILVHLSIRLTYVVMEKLIQEKLVKLVLLMSELVFLSVEIELSIQVKPAKTVLLMLNLVPLFVEMESKKLVNLV